MKHLYKIFFFIHIFLLPIGEVGNCYAQTNLVPNYSFEKMNNPCAGIMTVIPYYLQNWYLASISPSIYYNNCANTIFYPSFSTTPHGNYGYQFPKTGDGFVGISIYGPEPISGGDSINHIAQYVSVKLNTPLKANTCYYGEFYTSLADICKLGTNRIGMYLSQNTFTTSLGSFTNTIQPQVEWDTTKIFTDTLNWVKPLLPLMNSSSPLLSIPITVKLII